MTEKTLKIQDREAKRLAEAVLNNLLLMIKNPERMHVLTEPISLKSKRDYLFGILEWCKTEEYWFEVWEEYLAILPERLRKNIRRKVFKSLKRITNK